MLNLQNLDIINIFPPADKADIEAAEKALNLKFPKSYIDLLLITNGLDVNNTRLVQYYPSMEIKEEGGGGVWLYDIESVIEYNLLYEIKDNSPGFLLIGTDGGDEGYMLNCRIEDSPIYEVPDGGFFIDDGDKVAENIEDWISKKFKVQTEIELNYPDDCDLYMIKAPEGGGKELLNLKKTLKLDTSIGDLYRGAKNLPYLIKKNAYFYRAAFFSATYNKTDDCFRTFEPGSTTKEIPIPPWFYEDNV